MILKQSTAYTRMFLLIQSADHITALTGATATVSLSKAGGTFATAGGTVTEVANGWYKIVLTTTDTGTIGDLVFHITATSADATDFVDTVATNILGDTLPTNVTTWSGTTVTTPDTAGSPKVTITSGTGTGQLSITSGVVQASLVQILGTALTETAGQIAAGFKQFFNIASPTSTMNTITTVTTATTATNLTNAPTAGDFTATMKTSITTAATAATPIAASVTGAVGSVTGNVGGNVTGSVGSVTGAVGSVTGAVGSVTGNVGGNVVGSVGSVTGAVGSVTGNVGGNVVGSVASVTGAVASVTAGVTVTTNNDKTGYSLLAGQLFIKKNVGLNNFEFPLVSSTDHVTLTTGLTVAGQVSIDGGAFTNLTNAVSELGSGVYKVNLAAADVNGTLLMLKFTATGADTRLILIATQA